MHGQQDKNSVMQFSLFFIISYHASFPSV